MESNQLENPTNLDNWQERVDLAAAFQWAAELNMHEAVENHFSLAVSDDGTKFLMNPCGLHFSRITASSLLLLDAKNPDTMNAPNAPDLPAWSIHGAIHRNCRHAKCVMHVHSKYATILACLEDSRLPAIDQNSAMFFGRCAIDEAYGGLSLEDEGERIARLLNDVEKTVLIMGNHGVSIIGNSVADAFRKLYYFERAAGTYIEALQTGRALKYLPDEVARKVPLEMVNRLQRDRKHDLFLAQIKAILDERSSDYAT